MMEKDARGNALVLALTYSEETEHSQRSARTFDYKDVQHLMWNLRSDIAYKLGRTAALSFIAAGERGERENRCHWHVVLFSDLDLTRFGKWSAPWGPVSARSEIITPPGVKPAWRRGWSHWGHGFVTVQEPDYGGMRYALAYALKDQFSIRKGEGHGREIRSETFATGYFVPSKKPPIGALWVDRYVEQCRAAGIVPPSKRLTVPGLDRPFWPTGRLADRLLAGLASVNAEILERTGRPGTGWTSLLAEARENENDLETLGVPVEQAEQRPDEQSATFGLRVDEKHLTGRRVKARADRQAGYRRHRETADAQAEARELGKH